MQKGPASLAGPFSYIGMRWTQAARLAESAGASGTGPQMYAEKTGVGSVLSPRDITIPIGSDEACSVSLRSFFISLSRCWVLLRALRALFKHPICHV